MVPNSRFGLVQLLTMGLVCLCIGGGAVRGQTTLSGQIDLARLVDISSQRLGVRLSYDEAALKSKITLRQDRPLSDIELWQLTNRLLAEQGFTTIRAGDDDTIAVVKIAAAAQASRVERLDQIKAELAALIGPDAAATKPVRPGFRRVLAPLQRASSKDVLSAVQLVLSKPGGVVTESEQAGLVVIADLTPYLDVALKLVEQIDGTEGGAVVREVPARNLDPARLATLARQLADKRKAAGARDLRGEVLPGSNATGPCLLLICPPALADQWLALIGAADQREPVERRTYTPGSFAPREVANLIEQTVRQSSTGASVAGASGAPSDDRWKLILDDLTGSLIITASPAQHEQITELLTRLAAIPAEHRRPVRTFKIRNRAVKEVQQLVQDLLRAGVLQADGAPAITPAPGAAPPQPTLTSQSSPRSFGPGGTVAVPESSSTAATFPLGPSPHQTPRPAALGSPLTLTSDEATNTIIAVGDQRLLAQLEQLLPTMDVRQPQVMLEATLVSLSDSQSLSLGVELEKIRLSGDTFIKLSSLFGLSTASGSGTTSSRTVGDSSGFSGVVLNPGDFSVIIRALRTINQGRSLSNPKLLVNNNQQATFNSVLQQPFASTNASTTVSTTSFGGTQDAGTTISVKPQIAEGDHLVLTYSVSLSSFVGAAANANLPPPRQQNSVQSVATIPDGYTVVVGGLELRARQQITRINVERGGWSSSSHRGTRWG